MLETTTKRYIDMLNEANSSEEDTDLTAGSILFRLNESSCEDTFVLRYLDDILEGVFSQEPLLQQEWANGWLTASKEEKSTKALKPDWVAFVKPWINKFDLAVCEVKPPNKSVSSP
ncbi:hypothetical protein BC941DRAFT_451710 [Chlamydoabsidia padenii]|nr:hypothetical protein BC941DRAFT_451710 [Chlamydoabsidia padenii]